MPHLRQHPRDAIDRVVAGAVAGCFGPVEDHLHALLQSARGFRLRRPDRRQHLEHVARLDGGYAQVADDGEHVGLERGEPLRLVLLVLEVAACALCTFSAASLNVGTTMRWRGDAPPAGPRRRGPYVGCERPPRALPRATRGARSPVRCRTACRESRCAASTAWRPSRIDDQIETVAVAVLAGLLDVAHVHGGERLSGCGAPRFRNLDTGRVQHDSNSFPLTSPHKKCGMAVDLAGRQ